MSQDGRRPAGTLWVAAGRGGNVDAGPRRPAEPVDVLALGELLVDMVANQAGPLAAATSFTRAAGGAPANLAASVAKLGRRSAFVGLVGDDPFGRYLRETLEAHGVDTTHLGYHPRGRTPVAFAAWRGAGEGWVPSGCDEVEFVFYREGGADQLLNPALVPLETVASCRVLAAGGVSLSSALPRAALHTAIDHARANGVTVAFDANWRPGLWQFPERAGELYGELLPGVDILKLSAGELAMLAGDAAGAGRSPERALRQWAGKLVEGRARPLLIALTRGASGSTFAFWKPGQGDPHTGSLPACAVQVKDPTGAGDAFLAGLLVALLDLLAPAARPQPRENAARSADRAGAGEKADAPAHTPAGRLPRLDLGRLDAGELEGIFMWANAAGALATTRRGAMAALPGRGAVTRMVKKQQDRQGAASGGR